MRKNKYVEIEYRGYDIPDRVDEFVAWIKAKVAEQPVPKDKIRIEIGCGYEYGDSYEYLSLAYDRPETNQEQDERLAREKIAENAERARYLKLKEKFG